MNRIKNNVVAVKKKVGVPIILMTKADAYGHGLCKVAKYVEDEVDGFGVETLEEGLRLRRAGIKKEILTLALCPCEIAKACDNNLTIALHNEQQIVEIENLTRQKRINPQLVKVQIKVDCGMHRLGFSAWQLEKVLPKIKALALNVVGVYSHLRDDTPEQIAWFERLASVVKNVYPLAKMHLASSRFLDCENLRYDAVRLGIKAYEGAMSAHSQVLEARFVKRGQGVGYDGVMTERDTNVAVVFGGYADGIARETPSSVWIGARKCKVLGVCMDCFLVDTGDFSAPIGEKVTLFDGDTIEQVAKERGTIDYAVMTSLHGRIVQKYIEK